MSDRLFVTVTQSESGARRVAIYGDLPRDMPLDKFRALVDGLKGIADESATAGNGTVFELKTVSFMERMLRAGGWEK